MLKIINYPNPILRQVAQPVTIIDKPTKLEAQAMLKTLVPKPDKAKGVGLAANQVGILKRIFIIKLASGNFEICINPQILKTSKKTLASLPQEKRFSEGCLCFPGYYGFVDRPIKAKVSYQNLFNKTVTTTLTPPHSSYFQHELDHLNGILFIDYINQSKQQLYLADKKTGQLQPVKNPFI